MINRRTYFDDSKGVGEPLNERVDGKEGIKVPVTFWFEFKNLKN